MRIDDGHYHFLALFFFLNDTAPTEIYPLPLLDPLPIWAGPGSRLLAATVDLLREDGVTELVAWVFEADTALRGFLEPAGWAADGARKVLDLGEPVPMKIGRAHV